MVTISGGGLASNVVVDLTMNVTATYAIALDVNDNTMGSATINGGTAAIYVTEDDVITLVATEKPGYEFVNWIVSNENIVLDDENAASTTAMVGAAGTITAYFQSLPCTVLSAPTLDGTVETTYYSATLNWNEVANADGYSVEVKQGDVTKGSDVILAAPLSFTVTGLEANTTYTYTIQSVGDGTAYCAEGGVLAGSFTTADYPTAVLTLSENGVERVLTGSYKLNDVVALPTTSEQTCVGKTLVGWSEVAVTATDTKPASQYYDAGADYTFTSVSATLYAVYATGGAGDDAEIFAEDFSGCTGTGGNDGSWSGSIATTSLSLTDWTIANGNAADGCAKFGSGSKKGSAETPSITLTGNATLTFRAGAWNGSSEKTTLNISATGATLDKSSVTLTKGEFNTYTVAISDATGSIKIKFEANDASNNRFFLDDVVVYETAVAYSAYTTTCVAALAAPIFSVEGGTYTTAQSIELNTAEGTIYYTLDGTDPTDESTEYTEAIVLDACATTTVKAIAISADNSSEIAEATYVINLGIPANSAAAPYTPAEAIDVYNSGCYNSEEVFVKGVVTTANLQGSGPYAGTYNVYVKGEGTDGSVTFEFYNMYKDGENGTFTEGDIAAGDIILAKGVLSKYISTYEFASGCEMVEHTPYEASKTSIANTIENPYTVAEAIVFCEDGITYDLSEEVYVRGVVTSINTSNNTIFIHDADAENEFQLFHADLNENEVGVNDIVIAKGTLLKYNATTYEMTEGCLIVNVVKYVSSVTGVTIVETASVKVGKTITLIAEVAPADATNKNVSWESDNTSVATVDENGVVTGVAEGTAHITVTTEDGSFTAMATITVEAAPSFTGGEWVLVTDVAQLNMNDYIIIASSEYNKAMSSTQNDNNRGEADVTIAGGILTYESAPAIFTLKEGNAEGQYAFYDEDVNGYLFAASSSKNYLRTQAMIDANASWEITITDGAASVVAQGTNTHNLMQYNNSSKIFSCYETAQQAVGLYKYYSTPLPRYTVTFTANGGTGDAPVVADQLEGAKFNLPSNTYTYAGHQFTGWNDGTTTYAAGASYTMPATNVTFTAQWETVCAWATVYTSNVVFTGTGSYETNSYVKIGGVDYDAQKVGATDKDGSVVVTVPAGAHTLHFHAAAWNGSSVTIKASGVENMNMSSFAIAGDAGVKSSGTYTLANDPVDQHFHFTFDAVTETTEITFSKKDGNDRRFVMYGINQEGGPELQSITIGGNATNTEYVYGQTFNPAGLTVSAVYRVSGVDQDPVDVTDRVVWTFDPAEFNSTSQTSVTATATFETKSASKTVDVTVSEPATPNVTYTAIVVKKGDKYYAMGQTLSSSGALNAVELEDVVNGKMVNVPVEDRTALTWIITETEDGATFQAQNGKYLSGTSSNSTDLSFSTEPVVWAWNDTYGCYAIGGRSFYMYNSTTQFKNFALSNMNNTPSQCSSKPENLNEYIDIDNTKEIVTLRSGLENGKIGTMCWNADIYEVEGAYFFEPEMKQADGVCFAEAAKNESGVYPMGKPYVFQATGEEIRAVVSKTNTTTVAGTNNGLHGVLGETVDVNGENYYIIYQNRLYTANNNYIVANRAYIVKSELPGASANPAPNRRRLVIGRDNLPTGIESIVLNAEQVKKVLVDGQIYIVRDGKLYDLTGKVVR